MREVIQDIVQNLFPGVDVVVQTEIPEAQFGDLSTNVAMQLAGRLQKNPREIAGSIADELQQAEGVEKVDIAGPGFINVTLTDKQLIENIYVEPNKSLEGKIYVLEYSCPNWFKELHTGHLYQTVVGDALARILESNGAEVKRISFGGDVGLHVARAMWSILRDPEGYKNATDEKSPQKRAEFITSHYVAGTKAYEDDEDAKTEIRVLNKQIYLFAKNEDTESIEAKVYFTTREWGTEYFNYFYDLIRVEPFDKYYPESSTEQKGLEAVNKGLEQGVFKRSDDAVIYEGEKVDLHTRVFMTREGLPTYEAKDLGVILLENEQYNFDQRVLMTGSDQRDYMKVVWAALEELEGGYKDKMQHLVHGIVKFADGSKMSSRVGNVARAVDVVEAVSAQVSETNDRLVEEISLGAVKYEFIKYAIGSDIAFDIENSVSTKGNSGPYLQYAHARARSILRKAGSNSGDNKFAYDSRLAGSERTLIRKLGEYASVVEQASSELAPHVICTYLYELAQVFNRFYEENKVIGSEDESPRIQLVSVYAETLQKGLNLLGIHAPEEM